MIEPKDTYFVLAICISIACIFYITKKIFKLINIYLDKRALIKNLKLKRNYIKRDLEGWKKQQLSLIENDKHINPTILHEIRSNMILISYNKKLEEISEITEMISVYSTIKVESKNIKEDIIQIYEEYVNSSLTNK